MIEVAELLKEKGKNKDIRALADAYLELRADRTSLSEQTGDKRLFDLLSWIYQHATIRQNITKGKLLERMERIRSLARKRNGG